MRSVADDLRRDLSARVSAMSAEDRLALTERLAFDDLELFCAAQGVDHRTGRHLLERRRQAGRRASRALESLLE